MSGGSYDYGYCKVDDFIDSLEATTPLRKAFRKHLELVSNAMRAIEWVDSGDCSKGDEDEDIRKVQLINKYRRQGFTWDTAFEKAQRELENPSLFEDK